MQMEELNALIDKTATLMVQYERRGANIDARLQALGEELQGRGLGRGNERNDRCHGGIFSIMLQTV